MKSRVLTAIIALALGGTAAAAGVNAGAAMRASAMRPAQSTMTVRTAVTLPTQASLRATTATTMSHTVTLPAEASPRAETALTQAGLTRTYVAMPTQAGASTTTTASAALTNGTPPATLSPHHVTGQPMAECGEDGPTPGNAALARGSAFNPDGIAGTMYAGEQPQNSRNTASVSQYDAACLHQ